MLTFYNRMLLQLTTLPCLTSQNERNYIRMKIQITFEKIHHSICEYLNEKLNEKWPSGSKFLIEINSNLYFTKHCDGEIC